MMQKLIRTPVIPRNKADPTQSAPPVNQMFRDIEERYYRIKVALKQLFDEKLAGRERASNQQSHAARGNVIYQVNAGTYIYDMSAPKLADLLQRIQIIVNDYLLEGNSKSLWAYQYVAVEYERGTQQCFHESISAIADIRATDNIGSDGEQPGISKSGGAGLRLHLQRLDGHQ